MRIFALHFPRLSSLRFRLTGLGLVLSMLIVGAMSYVMVSALHGAAQRDVANRIETMDTLMVSLLLDHVVSNDLNDIYNHLERFTGQGNVAYVAVRNVAGEVMATSAWNPITPYPAADNLTRFPFFISDQNVFTQVLPLRRGDEQVGDLIYGLSVADTKASLRQAVWYCAWVALASLGLLIGLQFFIGSWLLTPLDKLGKAARSIADGDYHATLPAPSTDEMSELTQHFSNMQTALNARMAEVHEQQNMLHAVSDYAYAWELWINPSGQLYWSNAAAERVVGYTREECLILIGGLTGLTHPDDQPRLLRSLSHAAETRTAGEGFEFRVRHRRGDWIWLTANWHPIYSIDHDYQGMRLSLLDCTQQRYSREALNQAFDDLQEMQVTDEQHLRETVRERARLSALLSALSIGIVLVDEHDKVVYANSMFINMWGLSSEAAIIGVYLPDLVPRIFNLRPTFSEEQGETAVSECHLDDGRVVTFQQVPIPDLDHDSLWIFADVTAERATAEQLMFLAERDTLTGVYNRRRFQSDLDKNVKRAVRREQPMALLMFDLNDFKIINDMHGHAAGDQVLIDIARAVSKTIRTNEVFCRLGGDEFAILLPEASTYDATMLAKRIEAIITELHFEFDGCERRTSASIGIAVYPNHAENADTLVHAADTAMYEAKKLKTDKRGSWVVFDATMDLTARHALHPTQYVNEQRLEPTVIADALHDTFQPADIDELFG